MGCKTSLVRSEGSTEASNPEVKKIEAGAPSSAASPQPTKNAADATQPENKSTEHDLTVPPADPRRPSRDSIPLSARRSSGDNSAREHVQYAQDDDPFAPPPPLHPEVAGKSDSALTMHASSGSDSDVDNDEESGVLGGRQRHENHFDPIPMPATAQPQQAAATGRPADESPPPSKVATKTFRMSISDRDKTDSAQAAKEYQQRMEAKRTAEEVHTKRRRLEEFDPVRPVDSFNVTHRGLLGRCWDRRAPELIPVSFVHSIAQVLGLEESHPASTTTVSHMSGGDEFPPGSPIQHPSRLSRQSGTRGSTNNTPAPAGAAHVSWTGVGGRRVPRRSHWFSVGGVSTDGVAPPGATSPTVIEPFYVSSTASSPTGPRGVPGLPFPASTAALMVGGGFKMGGPAMHVIMAPTPAVTDAARASPKKAASTNVAGTANDSVDAFGTKTLTAEQVMALPWETREKYFNIMIGRNPRFMGIKDTFAFKLGSGVSNDRSVKFLRKRNLEPAPGVTAVRWNRVEFFHPSLHTLVRAVGKTQGMSMELQQMEQASSSAAPDGAEANCSGLAIHANPSMGSRNPSVIPSSSGPEYNNTTTATAEAEGDGGAAAANLSSQELLHRSFSQFVMGHVENRSFARSGNGGGNNANGDANNVSGGNASFLANASQAEKNSMAGAGGGGGHDKGAGAGLFGGGSFLMGLHRNRSKDGEAGGAESLRFPEDSVLALALGMPYSRLGMLAGVPAAVRNAALSNAGRLSSNLMYPYGLGLGSRKTSRDTMNGTTGNFTSPRGSGGGFTPLRANAETVLVSLSVSCFSVSINPFEWQERHYTRNPVDIDGSKRSARSNYGEGVITDVMYGGLMVVECSSMEAVKELQGLLASMTWTEDRSLQGIVKDVRKHLKTVHANLHKSRQAAAAAAAAAKRTSETASNAAAGGRLSAEETSKEWSAHRYRIIRRIGGRPMRDAVELEEISVFFDEDEEMQEARTILHQPDARRGTPAATNQGSPASGKTAPPALNLDKSSTESRHNVYHSSPNGPDPDITSSFSRVASAWFGLPVISAVLRTWGLHLLSCPEYAQPTAMFLQKHAGISPVLQLTALGSFYHDGNTPSDEGNPANDADYLFFECDGAAYAETQDDAATAVHRSQSARRIPKYNRFYASLPQSPVSTVNGEPHTHRSGHSHDGGAEEEDEDEDVEEDDNSRVDSSSGGKRTDAKRSRQYSSRSTRSKPGSKDAPTAASSPSHIKASTATLDELHRDASGEAGYDDSFDLRPQRRNVTQIGRNNDGGGSAGGTPNLGPKSYSKETVVGEGGMHATDSVNSGNNPPAWGRQSTCVMSASDKASVTGAAPTTQAQVESDAKVAKTPKTKKAAATTTAAGGVSSSAPPDGVAVTRPSSRCDSPISPGKETAPHSRRNDDRRLRRGGRRVNAGGNAGSPMLSAASSSASFFETSSDNNTRHSTFVYQQHNPNNSNNNTVAETSTMLLEREVTSPLRGDLASVGRQGTAAPKTDAAATSAAPAGRHVGMIASADDTLNQTESPFSPHPRSPQLFMPSPSTGFDQARDTCVFELVAMAKTVGPEESLAAQEAHRRANAQTPAPSPEQAVGFPHSPLGVRRAVGGAQAGAADAPAPFNSATPASTKASSSSEGSSAKGKKKTKKAVIRKTNTKNTKKAAAAEASSAEATTTGTTSVEEGKRKSAKSDAAAAILAAAPATEAPSPQSPLPLQVRATTSAFDATEGQIRPMGTPTGHAGLRANMPGTPTGVAFGGGATFSDAAAAMPVSTTTTTTAHHRVREEEAEGLWYMTMLEVKAQQQELEELRHARVAAEDHRQKRQDELRALNRVFLPHTHPQDLDCTLLYLKTVLFEPDDIPHGRLFLQQPDWLPLLAAVWTSPANRIRSVEIAHDLTWMDIPRLGLLGGLLYHHNASCPLEELIIRADKLLGAPRQLLPVKGGDDTPINLPVKKKKLKLKKDKTRDSLNASISSLNFVTELDRTGSGFGPGCPPFFIAPEEARDTLWLLLCAVATNTATSNFRVVLKGIPTPDTSNGSGGGGGGGSGGGGAVAHERTASQVLTSFFSPHRKDGKSEEPLLLRPESMLLDSFVVQPTHHDSDDGNNQSNDTGKRTPNRAAVVPSVKVSGTGTAGAQSISHSNNFDEAGFIATTAGGSLRSDTAGLYGRSLTAVDSPQQHSPNTSRQPSSLVIVTSSLSLAASPGPHGGDEPTGSFSPDRHTKRSLSTLMTLRSGNNNNHHNQGRNSPLPKTKSAVAVPTHQHHVKRRPWLHEGAEVEERPFYEVLMHHCGPIEEARIAAANSADPSLLAAPYIAHYHHPYNASHNDARFYVSVNRQEQLQQAVRRAVAVANGEATPRDPESTAGVYLSKPLLSTMKPKEQQQEGEQAASQPQSSGYNRTPSPPPPPPPAPVPCPPPLLFCESNVVFGLQSAEEEMRVLHYEETQLRDRAADIWEALRKSVKHYNQAQHDARHKAMKGVAKNQSPPPPMKLITLEH